MKSLNAKLRNISDKLKYMYGITVGTNHSQCTEPPYPIIKCLNFNRRPIQNCILFYQMKLCTVSIAFIVSRRPVAFIKRSRSSDPIDYLLCNQCEVHFSDKDTDKSNGPQFIWPDCFGVFYTEITSATIILLSLFGIFPLEWREWWFDGIVLQFPAYYNSISINEPQ